MSAPGISYSVGLDASAGISGAHAMESAMSGMHGIASKLTGALGLLGVSFAAFKSGEGIVEGFKDVFESGKELLAQSRITGQSIKDMVVLKKAYSEVGIEAGTVTNSLAMLQNGLGGVNEEGIPTKKVFEQLGLSIDTLSGETAIQQLEEIGGAINNLSTQAMKMKAVRDIFGRQGASMLALFGDPHAIEEAGQLVGKQAAIFERDAVQFAKVTNALEGVAGKVRGVFVGAGAGAASALMPLLSAIRSIDTVSIGQSIGKSMALAATMVRNAMADGTLGKLAGMSLRIGFSEAIDWLAKKWGELSKQFEGSGKSWFSGLVDVFKGLGNIIGGTISKAIADALEGTRFGRTITSKGDRDSMRLRADANQYLGQFQVDKGSAAMGPSSFFGGFFSTVTKGSASLYKEFDKLVAQAQKDNAKRQAEFDKEKGQKLGTGIYQQPGRVDTEAKTQRIQPLSDALSKIGLFIGGNGGSRGEAAQRDTAKNTEKTASLLSDLPEKLKSLIKPGVFA